MPNPRNNKRKYFQHKPGQDAKRSKREDLAPGMTGFLISCSQGNETRSVVEAYDVLNQHMDNEQAKLDEVSRETKPTGNVPPSDDAEKAIAEELKSFSTNAGIEERKARFKAVDSGCSNQIFISSAVADPAQFALSLLTDIHSTGKGRARYMQRILPVVATCKADLDSIKKAAATALVPYFSGPENKDKSYLILYKTRNNGTAASRDDVIEAIGSVVKGINSECRANLNDPDCAISVDVIKSMCCISLALNYCKLKKYNIHVDEVQSHDDSRVNKLITGDGQKSSEEPKNGSQKTAKEDANESEDTVKSGQNGNQAPSASLPAAVISP